MPAWPRQTAADDEPALLDDGCRAFAAEGPGVHLCPEARELEFADAEAAIDVLLPCASTSLR